MVLLLLIVRSLESLVLLLVLYNYAGWAVHIFVVARWKSPINVLADGSWKSFYICPPSQNYYIGLVVNLLTDAGPLRTAHLWCICCLCSWLTGHFCVLSHRSGTNQRRRDRGFNAAKRRAACLSHSCPRTMTVRSCFCRNGLRGAVKSSIGAISLCWSETFPSMQLILIELCVLVTNIFHWNRQDRIKALSQDNNISCFQHCSKNCLNTWLSSIGTSSRSVCVTHRWSSALVNCSTFFAFSRPRIIFYGWIGLPSGEAVDATLGFTCRTEVPLSPKPEKRS